MLSNLSWCRTQVSHQSPCRRYSPSQSLHLATSLATQPRILASPWWRHDDVSRKTRRRCRLLSAAVTSPTSSLLQPLAGVAIATAVCSLWTVLMQSLCLTTVSCNEQRCSLVDSKTTIPRGRCVCLSDCLSLCMYRCLSYCVTNRYPVTSHVHCLRHHNRNNHFPSQRNSSHQPNLTCRPNDIAVVAAAAILAVRLLCNYVYVISSTSFLRDYVVPRSFSFS